MVAGLFRISALEMLILSAVELQIRPNWESALEMLMLGAGELQIRPNGAYKIKGYPTFIVNQAVMQSTT